MSINTQQTVFGIAFKPQAALQTANDAADFWKITKGTGGFAKISKTRESNADEMGKGSEFATQSFDVNWEVSGSLEKYLSSELAAWAFAFGLGNPLVPYAAGAYTMHEAGACDTLDLPSFTFVEQIGALCPGGAALDRSGIGCVVSDFGIKFQSGPGRSSAMLSVSFVGCGANAEPSGIVLPGTTLPEHEMKGGNATVNINGTDYTSGKGLLSLDMSFQNNVRLDQGFFIGCGEQGGALIRGRMERGKRVYSLSFVTRLEKNSPEYAKFAAGDSGPATITLTNSAAESLTVLFHKVDYKSVDLGDDQGIATVQVNCEVYEHPVNGVLTVTAKTAVTGIGQTA